LTEHLMNLRLTQWSWRCCVVPLLLFERK
jgi:hypothetical protein